MPIEPAPISVEKSRVGSFSDLTAKFREYDAAGIGLRVQVNEVHLNMMNESRCA